MSAIIMHNHFSKIVYNGLDENVKNAVNNVNLYEYAANGPDPFKYHRFLNKKQRLKYKEIWNTMSNKNVKAFISLSHSLSLSLSVCCLSVSHSHSFIMLP